MTRRRADRVVIALVLLTSLSACAGLSDLRADQLTITSPSPLSTVQLPVTVEWHAHDLPSSVNQFFQTNVVTNDDCVVGDASAFHEYVTEWSSTTITVKIDGQTCLVDHYKPWGTNPFAQPYFVALTQALWSGTNAFAPATTPLPATTTIDYVRVWK